MKYSFTLLLLSLCPHFIKAQLKVADGIHFVITNGANVIVNDLSLVQGNVSLLGQGKVVLSGSSTTNTITAGSSINNLSINKTGGASVKLLDVLNITGAVELVNGKLDLNGNDLDLGTTGTLSGENENNHITGTAGFITRQAILNSPLAANPGNLGLTITSASNLGLTTIKRGNYALSDGSNYTIQRFFDVIPANNTNLDASIKFDYLDANLGTLQENQFKFLSSADGGNTWDQLVSANIDVNLNNVQISGLNSLGRYSLANDFVTLPISSISLTGKQTVNGINVKWSTLGETRVSHFWLEKSTDGQNFRELSRVTSLSNVKKDNIYEALDRNPFKGINYYRVRSVDFDGETSTSAPAAINFDLTTDNATSIYPNPTVKNLFGSFYNGDRALTTIEIVSVLGKTEIKKTFSAEAGLNNFSFDVSHLPPGTYFIKVTNNALNKTLKFIKN